MHAAKLVRLDLLIPTLGRADLLRATLESIRKADAPRHLDISVSVINNDRRPELPGLQQALADIPYPTRVLHEPTPGKSAALNAGIAASTADYVGLIDDDEELARDWFHVAEEALTSGKFDFIGGRQVLVDGLKKPAWIPAAYPAVLGIADAGPDERPYSSDFRGILMGGNAVISRAVLAKVGPYDTDLGPRVDRRLFSCEDEDMYLRLLDAGARGQYLPQLVVYHHVHPKRLRKSYYRAWCFWNGASKSVLNRRRPSTVPEIAGVPRYLYGKAVRGLATWLRETMSRGPADVRFAGELPLWQLAGWLYGHHLYRTDGSRRSTTWTKSRRETAALLG